MTAVTDSRLSANLRHIAKFEAKDNPKPLSFTAVTRGFEKFAFPKIVQELGHTVLSIRKKSVLACQELLTVSENYVQCIAAGITPALVRLLQDPEDVVRERAAAAMELLCTKELGARDIIQWGGHVGLVGLLTDEVPAVRVAAYKALVEGARFDAMRRALVAMKTALPMLVEKVNDEQGERPLLALSILRACVQMRANEEALQQAIDDANAISKLVEQLDEGGDVTMQQGTADLFASLTATRGDAKVQAVQQGAVPRLLHLLEQSDLALATSAAAALMMITISREGKYSLLNAEGLDVLVRVLQRPEEQLLINVLETITNAAEAPECRFKLQALNVGPCLALIQQNAVSTLVDRAAAQAMRQLQFSMRPFELLPGVRNLP